MPSSKQYRGYHILIEWEPLGWTFAVIDLVGPSKYFYRSAWGATWAARSIIDKEIHNANANSDHHRAA